MCRVQFSGDQKNSARKNRVARTSWSSDYHDCYLRVSILCLAASHFTFLGRGSRGVEDVTIFIMLLRIIDGVNFTGCFLTPLLTRGLEGPVNYSQAQLLPDKANDISAYLWSDWSIFLFQLVSIHPESQFLVC